MTSTDVHGKLEYSNELKSLVTVFCHKRRALYFNCRAKWKYRSGEWSLIRDIKYTINSVEIYDTKYAFLLDRYYKIENNLFLDIGCGWGPFEISIAMRSGEVVGIEIDKDAIGLAIALAREHGMQDRINFIVADARRLPFREAVFDGVVSFGTFEHIPNADLAIKEGWQALKNGGIFYFETPNRLFPYDYHDTNLYLIHWLPSWIANPVAYALHRVDPSHMRPKSRNGFELNRYLTYWGVSKILGNEAEIVSSVESFSNTNTVTVNHKEGKLTRILGIRMLLLFKRTCNFFNIPMTPFLPALNMVIFKKGSMQHDPARPLNATSRCRTSASPTQEIK